MEVTEKTKRSVTVVFIFATHDFARSRKAIRPKVLQCRNAGLFVDADRMNATSLIQGDCFAVGPADIRDLLIGVWVGFVIARQSLLVLVRSDFGSDKQFANPASANRLQQSFKLQLQGQFSLCQLRSRSIAVPWVFTFF
jgi:hypothetical protein